MSKRESEAVGSRRRRRSAEQWRQEVLRWRSSGQTAREYAEAHDVHSATLMYWSSRLGFSGGSRPRVKARPQERPARERSTGLFVPVSVVPSDNRVVASPSRGRTSSRSVVAEFELGGGRRLRVAGLDDLKQLAELVGALEEQLGC